MPTKIRSTTGQSVQVSIPTAMGTYTGTVEKINKVRFISPEGAVHFEAVVAFQNPGTLTAGMNASAHPHRLGRLRHLPL